MSLRFWFRHVHNFVCSSKRIGTYNFSYYKYLRIEIKKPDGRMFTRVPLRERRLLPRFRERIRDSVEKDLVLDRLLEEVRTTDLADVGQ